jgi:hypothetical protein
LELGLRLGLGLGLGLGFEIGLGFGMPAAPPLGLARSSGRDSLSPRPSFFRCAGFRRGAVAAAGTSGSPPIEVRKMSPPPLLRPLLRPSLCPLLRRAVGRAVGRERRHLALRCGNHRIAG